MIILEEHRFRLAGSNAESNREARECIKGAMISLLRTERNENIRMTDITRKSRISRAGIWKIDKSKDEIMRNLHIKPLNAAFLGGRLL